MLKAEIEIYGKYYQVASYHDSLVNRTCFFTQTDITVEICHKVGLLCEYFPGSAALLLNSKIISWRRQGWSFLFVCCYVLRILFEKKVHEKLINFERQLCVTCRHEWLKSSIFVVLIIHLAIWLHLSLPPALLSKSLDLRSPLHLKLRSRSTNRSTNILPFFNCLLNCLESCTSCPSSQYFILDFTNIRP